MQNYYHILGLSFESKPEPSLIRAAYKALVKLYHPDVFSGDRKNLKRKINEINEAFDVLSNPEKKIKYDIDLKKFQKNNSADLSQEKFEDSDMFNPRYVDEDWEIATIVYPELENKKIKLNKFSQKLALQFQFYLLETKEFHIQDFIIDRFLNAFLEKKFGTSKPIRNLSKILIEENHKSKAMYLNKLVKVVGSKSDKKILNAFFKRYPEIEDEMMSKMKLPKVGLYSKKTNGYAQEIIILISLTFLFLYIFILD